MIFVELGPVVDFCAKHWGDEDLRALQNHMLVTPDTGVLSAAKVGYASRVGRRRGERSGAATSDLLLARALGTDLFSLGLRAE